MRFGDGRRPEQRTQVRMVEFDGPLALLLSLIEARQLDILTVPLGALAGAYLEALAPARVGSPRQRQLVRGHRQPAHPDQEPGNAPAANRPDRSGALADDGVDPEAELRARLLIYRAYRDAGVAPGRRRRAPRRPVPA